MDLKRSDIVIPIGVVGGLIVAIMAIGEYKGKVLNAEDNIVKVNKLVEKSNDRIKELEQEQREDDIRDTRQTVLMESLIKTLDKLNEKIEKKKE